ncbi:hypothetical protein KIN20_015516 [Parelaphostrongylus tenuis]|uniref:Protein HIRA-like C-terminal domain-containing protein n=1 Tax=Parelaphostrongylus tenuis TaxID=148309 RepID=A0AAD5MG78_PARTN|nr:hypothetical protein KIN20_015516 [Parelaphostrongylus tenuis]
MFVSRSTKYGPAQYCNYSNGGLMDTPSKTNSFIDSPEELVAKRKAEAAISKEQSNTEPMQTSTPPKAAILTEQRQQQLEIRTSDGKRRIQPIFLGSTVDAEPTPVVQAEIAKDPVSPNSYSDHTSFRRSACSSQVDDPVTSDTDDTTARDRSSPPLTKSLNRLTSTDDSILETTDDDVDSSDVDEPVLRPVESSRIEVVHASTILDVPEQRATICEGVQAVLGDTVEVDNDWVMGGVRASRISYLHARLTVWSVEIEPAVAVVVANRSWTIIGCYDRSVFVYASSNGRLHFRNQMDSAPVRMGVNGHKMYVLTQTGHLSTWDIDKNRAIMSRQSIADCVEKDANLTSISLTPTGIPLLGFSTGNIFTFSIDMNCWQIVDSLTPLMKLCDSIEADELSDGPIGRLLKRRKRPGLLPSIPRWVSASVKESLLEGWLQAAKTIGSSVDYRGMMMTYVQLLVRNRSLSKISQILSDLSEKGTICGIQRKALREDVERIIMSDPTTAPSVRSEASDGLIF